MTFPMLADELLFEGGHVAHVAAYYERMRQRRIQAVQRNALNTRRRRRFG